MAKMPTNYLPRDYQLSSWKAFVIDWKLGESIKRGILLWPRRAGKDVTCLNIVAYHAVVLRPGNYYYFFPTYAQGKKAIWDGKDRAGRPHMEVFPGWPKTKAEDPTSLIESIDKREMMVKLTNGSLFQIVGTEDEDRIVGTGPVGCVFSEYSVMNPKAWEYVRPMLVENDGFALFTYTARGRNHGWRLYEKNKNNPKWHVELHTCETLMHNGKRVVTEEMIQDEIDSGMDEDLARQEFHNDFNASNQGAYYAKQMKAALDSGRIGQVPWRPELQVHTAWDIGHRDATGIWMFQMDLFGNINLIDTLTNTGEDVTYYIKELRKRPYTYGTHFGPHDLKNANFATGKSALEVALSLGVRFVVVPKLGVQEGIDAARLLLPRCRFNEESCFNGIEALRQYCKEESGLTDMEGKPIFRDTPKHDWTSHFADAFRYLAVAVDKILCHTGNTDINGKVVSMPDDAVSDYDMHAF
ncbi:MAG TPA: hypothetical protein VN081_03965 [Dongiaceae bacterium]|nr:hypothetical protein [Dongiaceae bacterium]